MLWSLGSLEESYKLLVWTEALYSIFPLLLESKSEQQTLCLTSTDHCTFFSILRYILYLCSEEYLYCQSIKSVAAFTIPPVLYFVCTCTFRAVFIEEQAVVNLCD